MAERDVITRADYVLLPNAVLWHPPVRHRHTSYWARHLTPRQIYILGGVLIAARAELVRLRHPRAMRAGATAIEHEVRDDARFKAEWRARNRDPNCERPAPVRMHWSGKPTHKPKPIRQATQDAGRAAYASARKNARAEAPDEVTVTITRRTLLRLSGMSPHAQNFRAVTGALNRLCRPVGAGGCEMPAALRDWAQVPGGLRLRVSGAWLPARRFGRVLWPPPKRSPAALAFWLLVHVLRTSKQSTREVSADWLACRLGLNPRANTGARNWALNQAFSGVNAKLHNLPDELVERLWGGPGRPRPAAGVQLPAIHDRHDPRRRAPAHARLRGRGNAPHREEAPGQARPAKAHQDAGVFKSGEHCHAGVFKF